MFCTLPVRTAHKKNIKNWLVKKYVINAVPMHLSATSQKLGQHHEKIWNLPFVLFQILKGLQYILDWLSISVEYIQITMVKYITVLKVCIEM